MNVFEPDIDVHVTLPFIDGEGEVVTPTALDYQVVDETGATVVALTNIGVFTAGDGQIELTVDSLDNALGAGVIRALRKVELRITVGTETYWVRDSYIIELAAPLTVLTNSFQTYDEAILTAREVPGLLGWDEATEDQRKAAMAQAYDHLKAFSYRFGYIDDSYEEKGVDDLDATDWSNLVASQKLNLQKAQIVQADHLLGGNPIESDIEAGLQSSTVGESSQFYRPRPSLILPICRAAVKYIGRYIVWNAKIARA